MDFWTEDPPIPRVAKPRFVLPNERLVDFPVPQIWEEITEVVSLVPQEYVQRQTDERCVDVPVPPILEDIVEVVRRAPQELVQQTTIVDVPLPHFMEEIVEEFKIVPLEQFSERVGEQIVDVLVPQVETFLRF